MKRVFYSARCLSRFIWPNDKPSWNASESESKELKWHTAAPKKKKSVEKKIDESRKEYREKKRRSLP